MMSKICGHRGAAYHKPENTISGFEWCVENKIDWAECDVQLTNENTLLIIHDETLDRTSDNKGSIKKILKSDLNRINVGKLSGKDFCFQKIPTLTELLKFCKKTMCLRPGRANDREATHTQRIYQTRDKSSPQS